MGMPLDVWLGQFLPPAGSSVLLDAVMVAATTVGLAAFVVGGPWWLGREDRNLRRSSLVALAVTLVATLVLQVIVSRARPEVASDLLAQPLFPSFPSGHAALVGAIAAMVTFAGGRAFWWWSAALVVAVSRVHLGHHFPSDVIGGLLLGAGIGVAVAGLQRAPSTDPWRWRWLLWPQLSLVLVATLAAYTGAFSNSHLPWFRVPGLDKVLHFGMFGLLAFGAHFATRGRQLRVGRLRLPVAVLLPLAGAVLEEGLQSLSPHRTADVLDLLADFGGMLLFWRLGCRITRESGDGVAVPSSVPSADSVTIG